MADVKQSKTTTTLGKELQDLDDACKNGLLSEKEYKAIFGRIEADKIECRIIKHKQHIDNIYIKYYFIAMAPTRV